MKNQPVLGNCSFDGCVSPNQNQVQRTPAIISEPPSLLGIRRNATSGVTIEEPDQGILMMKDRSANNQDRPSSQGLLSRLCGLAASPGSVGIEDPFLGFKSIFSFL